MEKGSAKDLQNEIEIEGSHRRFEIAQNKATIALLKESLLMQNSRSL